METYIPILIISCVSLIASLAFFIRKIKKCRSGCCEITTSVTRDNSVNHEVQLPITSSV